MSVSKTLRAIVVSLITTLCVEAKEVDVFVTAGQSNAGWNHNAWFKGIRDAITKSGEFENPFVVMAHSHPGEPLPKWFNHGSPQAYYKMDFFNSEGALAALQGAINTIKNRGDTVRFRGLFWFQGESDGLNIKGGSVAKYAERWHGMLNLLDRDIGHSNWYYVMNTVGNSGEHINKELQRITKKDPRGVLFDTQKPQYKIKSNDIHGYDHYAVGVSNAELFINSFVSNASDKKKLKE